MDDSLSTISRRREFYLIAVALLAILSTVRLLLPSPIVPGTLAALSVEVVDTIFATLIGTVVVTSLVIYLSPQQAVRAVMDIVVPFKIQETLDAGLKNSDEWWYRGHSGRHLRAVTMPQLAGQARSANLHKTMVIQILDPTNDIACCHYADYRNALRSAEDDDEWTLKRVRLELYATVLSAYAWKARQPLLDVEVGLLTTISLFRVDLSSRLALITKEDPREPALRFDEGTFFYDAYREELRLSLTQARIVTVPHSTKLLPFDSMTEDNVEQFLTEVGIFSPQLDNSSLVEIIRLAKEAKNPYA